MERSGLSETTNVPAPIFGPAGYVAPTGPAVLAGVQQDWLSAYAPYGQLNLALDVGTGQVIQSEAAIIVDKDSQFVSLTAMFDPAFSSGIWQDAIGRYYFQTRQPATATTPTCVCIGEATTVIPAGAFVTAEDGNTYSTSTGGTIPSGGTLSLSFTCAVTGPIACPAQVFDIGQVTNGWDTCATLSDATPGQNVETSQAFEQRRGLSVEQNSVNTNDAILGALLAGNGGLPLPGLISAYVVDNSTNTTATIGGVTLSANSIFVCAYGGEILDIGLAILSKKPPGCSYSSGTTTITLPDSNPLYNGNGPTYSVTFTLAAPLTIYAGVSIKNSMSVPSNAQALVQAAYDAAFAGTDGLPAVSQIGATTYAARFVPGIAALGDWAQTISSITVGTTTTPTSLTVTSTIAQVPVSGTCTLTLV